MLGGLVLGGSTFGGFIPITSIPAPPPPWAAAIIIDGVNVRHRVRRRGLTIHDILNDAPNTCSFTMEGDGPAVGQSLRITVANGARVLFAGMIQTVEQTFDLQPPQVAWRVNAIDDTALANSRRPFGTFVDVSATTIAQTITAQCAPGFSVAGIALGLPPVRIVFDGADLFIAALTRLATIIGGYAKVEDRTVYLFIEDTDVPPDPIDAAHPFLLDPPIRANVDSSQLRTRVYGKGYGESVQADIAAAETLIPIDNGANFPALGAEVIAAVSPDGAQSERFAYTGVVLRGAGTLVGPGAGPSNAPTPALAGGGVVTNGAHVISVVHVTAAGKSIEGPLTSIDVNPLGPPTSAPVAGVALTGTGPDQGTHDYAASFVTAFGETVPSPVSNAVTTSAASGQVAAPGSPFANSVQDPGPQPSNFSAQYQLTFVTAIGETEGGFLHPTAATNGPGFPMDIGSNINGTIGTAPGGGMTSGTFYRYWVSFGSSSGYETALTQAVDIGTMPAGHGSVVINQFVPHPDPRITKRRIYRTINNGSLPNNGLGGFFVTEQPNDYRMWTDTASDASISGNEQYFTAGGGLPSGPRGPDPGCKIQVTSIPLGPAGVTARKIYRRPGGAGVAKFVATISNNTATSMFDTVLDAALGADIPSSNTTGTAVQRIPVSAIPLGGASVTARKLYRRFNGAGTFKLVTTLNDNTTTTYTDAVANAALGAPALGTSTAVGNRIALSAIPVGPSGVTNREVYMSPAGGGNRYRALVIPDNTATTATLDIADATLVGQPLAPVTDTSGLQQPQGQVNPGATVLPVATAAVFRSAGGWVELGGDQVVRYGAASGQALTGIPASGPGAITTTVLYGSQAVPAPMLTGCTPRGVVLAKGAPIHLWVQRDDLQAQAEQRARAGGDGVIEYLFVDMRRGLPSLTARCDAELALFARPIITIAYATRDLKTRSGKEVTVNLAAPAIHETVTIQDVTITEIDTVPPLMPRFTVTASTVRFSLEDTLRRLVAGGQIVGGSS